MAVKVTNVGTNVANAGTGAITTTLAANVQYADSVIIYIRNGANATQSTTLEQSFDGGTTFSALDASFFESGGGGAAAISANATAVIMVALRSATNPTLHSRGAFPATHMRAKITGNAGAAATTLTTDFHVLYASNGPSIIPTS